MNVARISSLAAALLLAAALFPESLFTMLNENFASPRPVSVQAEDAVNAGFALNSYVEDAERELVRLTNEERTRAGLPQLEVDARLTQVAREHSEKMKERRELSHQFPGEPALRQRYGTTDVRVKRVGENVAYDESAREAHHGFMNSPGHRANILHPEYNAIGVGVVRRGDLLYITEDFADRLQEISVTEAEEEVAGSFERLRQRAGARLLPRRQNPSLREMACSMAWRDKLDSKPALGLPGVRYVVAYTASEPKDLPPEVRNMRSDREVRHYAVGACFQRSQNYPTGAYWILMAFY